MTPNTPAPSGEMCVNCTHPKECHDGHSCDYKYPNDGAARCHCPVFVQSLRPREPYSPEQDPDPDAEIICQWMEPKPDIGPFDFRPWRHHSPDEWWKADGWPSHFGRNVWRPWHLTLVDLWEVEEKLNGVQRFEYLANLLRDQDPTSPMFYTTHATAEQKIKALAAVLRGAL